MQVRLCTRLRIEGCGPVNDDEDYPPFPVKITAETHLIRQKGVDDIISLLLSPIEHECNAHREATDDFLVLSLMRILQHLVQAPRRGRSEHDESHSVPTGLTRNSRIAEQCRSQVFIRLCDQSATHCSVRLRKYLPSLCPPIPETPSPRAAPCWRTSSENDLSLPRI
jgi:hypothetical protein